MNTPHIIVARVTQAPIARDKRLPYIVRENTSLPTLSVPNHASADGACSRFTGSSACGSMRVMSGANIAISSARAMMASPSAIFGLFRIRRRNSARRSRLRARALRRAMAASASCLSATISSVS